MKHQEMRIVALSVIVTLLGGWVTMGEAEVVGPENCANRVYSFPAEGPYRTGQDLLDICSAQMSSHFGADCEATVASSCSAANGYVCSTQAP